MTVVPTAPVAPVAPAAPVEQHQEWLPFLDLCTLMGEEVGGINTTQAWNDMYAASKGVRSDSNTGTFEYALGALKAVGEKDPNGWCARAYVRLMDQRRSAAPAPITPPAPAAPVVPATPVVPDSVPAPSPVIAHPETPAVPAGPEGTQVAASAAETPVAVAEVTADQYPKERQEQLAAMLGSPATTVNDLPAIGEGPQAAAEEKPKKRKRRTKAEIEADKAAEAAAKEAEAAPVPAPSPEPVAVPTAPTVPPSPEDALPDLSNVPDANAVTVKNALALAAQISPEGLGHAHEHMDLELARLEAEMVQQKQKMDQLQNTLIGMRVTVRVLASLRDAMGDAQ